MRILLIDDTRDTTVVMRKLLEHAGYEVEATNDPIVGLELAVTFVPDVICIDIGLPTMTGYEVARRIREKPQLRNARVIAISGYAPDEERAAQAGIDAHLEKPASLAELIAAMQN